MTLELSKAVVLRAKELLSEHPRCSVLDREEFVSVCLRASQEFLKNRVRSSPPRIQTPRSERLDNGCQTTPRGTQREASGLLLLSERDELVLRQFLQREFDRVRHQDIDNSRDSKKERTPLRSRPQRDVSHNEPSHSFSSLHGIEVASAQLIKSILDEPYHQGVLSKSEYSNAVLSIMEEAFRHPQLSPVIDQHIRQHTNSQSEFPLPELLEKVLREMTEAVVLHYRCRASAQRDEADRIAHETRKTTHAVSVGLHVLHQHRLAHSQTPPRTSPEREDAFDVRDEQHIIAQSTKNTQVILSEEESAFDRQVEELKAYVRSAGDSRSGSTQVDCAADRKSVLEQEIRLLTDERQRIEKRLSTLMKELESL